MKIDNREIARLMRVTSEPLRRSWEKVMNNGDKLEDVISSRENATAKQKAYRRNSGICMLIMLPVMIVIFGNLLLTIMSPGPHRGVTLGLVLSIIGAVMVMAVSVWSLTYWSEKSSKLWPRIEGCERVLVRFQASVNALNPLGIGNDYHDVLTPEVVKNRIVDLAFKVVEAEDFFERLLKPGAIRSTVGRAYQWTEKCNAWFERIWAAANGDFALNLSKRDVFTKAVQEFELREGRLPAHIAPNCSQ